MVMLVGVQQHNIMGNGGNGTMTKDNKGKANDGKLSKVVGNTNDVIRSLGVDDTKDDAHVGMYVVHGGIKVCTPKMASQIIGNMSWRRIRTLCKQGKVKGAKKNIWNRWIIPYTIVVAWAQHRQRISQMSKLPW